MTATTISLQAGDVIFREGDPAGSAYLIDSGKIEISISQGGQRLVLSYLGPGDLLGEMSVLDQSARSAEARAVTQAQLTELKEDQIQERLNEADPILRALMESLLHRYRSGLSAARGTKVNLGPAPKVADKALEKMRLERQLINALDNDELSVVFQPLFDIAQNRVTGFEALTRWTHPERGNISPAEFIALAEETSLILPVGQYALRKSAEVLSGLSAEFPDSYIAVNISARQSAVPHFAELIVDQCTRHKIDPSRIELEITESLTLDYMQVRALIDRCADFGIKVSLDDFGTGFSNLGHLHELAFDTVKLDQAFTRQMLDNAKCLELVRGIVNLIHAIGAKVIAEGVETRAQADKLRELGVEILQGWHVGKPLPASEMPSLLRRVGIP
jgi:diguanylate cyclase